VRIIKTDRFHLESSGSAATSDAGIHLASVSKPISGMA
jgi:hypothetical protein